MIAANGSEVIASPADEPAIEEPPDPVLLLDSTVMLGVAVAQMRATGQIPVLTPEARDAAAAKFAEGLAILGCRTTTTGDPE